MKNLLALNAEFQINAIAHITGGGLIENVPRVLPSPPQRQDRFAQLAPRPGFCTGCSKPARSQQREMLRTFNCGVGMMLAVDAGIADQVVEKLQALGETAWKIGDVIDRADQDPVVFI